MFIWQFGYSISGVKTVCTINWFPELLARRTDDGDWELHAYVNYAPKFCQVDGYHPEMRIYELQ